MSAMTGSATPTPTPTPTGAAAALVASLEVKGRAPKTGYDRNVFGQAWADVDRNGCDTRNDVLRRDVGNLVIKPGSNGCSVLSGTLVDRYSGDQILLVAGGGLVEIDHVVSLSDAWQKGAQQWDPDTKLRFANDPLNLVAVSMTLNQQKSDGDAATWLPPNKDYRCTYVSRQAAVKKKFGLWVTSAEHDAMLGILETCPGQDYPTSDDPPAITADPAPAPTTATTARPAPAPTTARPAPAPEPAEEAYYKDCAAARAAGVAPIHRGQSGYRAGLDRDKDGVACE